MAGLSLEGKPWYFGLIIGLVLAAAIICGRELRLSSADIDQARSQAADTQIRDLDTKIEQGRSARAQAAAVPRGSETPRARAEKLRRILPSTRNTEEIIKKIKSLVDPGDFTLRKLTLPAARAPRRGAIRTPSGRSRSPSTAAITTWRSSSIG